MRSIAAVLTVLLVGATAADAKKLTLKYPKAGQASVLLITVRAKGAKKPKPKLKGKLPAGVGAAVAVRKAKAAKTFTEVLVVMHRGAAGGRGPVARAAQDFDFTGRGVTILPGVGNRGVVGAQRREGFLTSSLPTNLCGFSTASPVLTGGLLAGKTNRGGFAALLNAGCGRAGLPASQGFLCSYGMAGCAPPPAPFAFGTGPTFAPNGMVTGLDTGDLNGDGHLDLVSASASGLSAFLQNGDGTFAAPINFATGLNPVDVAVGDFDGNGKQDVAGISADGTLQDFLGDGSGGFTPGPQFVFLPAGRPFTSLETGLFNGDGRVDLAIPQGDGQVAVLLGQPGGDFAGVDYAAGGSGLAGIAIAVGDFNADGSPDLVVGQNGSGTFKLQILLGAGDGTFGVPQSFTPGGSPINLSAADVDLDGSTDLVVGETGTRVEIYPGTSGSLLGPPAPFDFASGTQLRDLGVADVNGDGRADLLGLDGSTGVLTALNSPGGFGSSTPTPFTGGTRVAAGDVNGDGVADVVAAGANGIVLLGDKP